MKCREVKYYLADYIRGKLIDEMRKEISHHLNRCHSCRKKAREIRLAYKSSGTFHREFHYSDGFWETSTDTNFYNVDVNLPALLYLPLKNSTGRQYKEKFDRGFLRSKWVVVGAPVSAILIAVLLSVMYFYRANPAYWEVETLKGAPVAGNEKIDDIGSLPVGHWLETDSYSSARLEAGLAGQVDVNPGSALQLLDTKEPGYKIYLKLGKITARTPGAPKMLSVVTPSASALDLGSNYSVEVNEDGSSLFSVSSGSLVIESDGENEILPAGVVLETVKDRDPGTPYRMNADEDFKEALSKLDFGNGTDEDLDILLDNASRKDALSLWYLLRDAEPGEVKLIFNKLAQFVKPPEGVTFEGIKEGDNNMLLKWWDKLGYGSKSLWNSLQG